MDKMVFLNKTSRHSEWRKVAKKLRRKRIRQTRARQLAEEQERIESRPEYQEWLQCQEMYEQERAKLESEQAAEREAQWKKREHEAQIHWQELQQKLQKAREEKDRQNMKIKLEWEREQERLRKIQIEKEKQLEEQRNQQEKQEKELEEFLHRGGTIPKHLLTPLESNPGKQLCPFFEKVSACRFFDRCLRNHKRPGISRVLLITNFFSDISLETRENEHGSDSGLEFENKDTYKKYKDFFADVVTELERYGKIRTFVTCCNHGAHLRGNVYVEFKSRRDALVGYQKLNGRWYAERQLNVQFCNITNWKEAICGMFSRSTCPKGSSCNFLHIFENPQSLYVFREKRNAQSERHHKQKTRERKRKGTPSDSLDSQSWNSPSPEGNNKWRWSQSPEPLVDREKEHSSERSRSSSRRRHRRS